MMIIFDYECCECGDISENYIYDSSRVPLKGICPVCNGQTVKILSIKHTSPIDSSWIPTVLDVVNKNSKDPHCTEFVKHPTRQNYKNWMKGEGIRHLEDGEKCIPKDTRAERLSHMKRRMNETVRDRNALTI